MEIIITKNPQEGSQAAFELIKEAVEEENAQVFGLATGSTPEGLYQLIRESDLDFSDKVSVNLDEYVGLPADHPQSYHYFMEEHLFSKKPFKKSYVPDGMADEETAIKEYDEIIKDHPIDVQILGIGGNGHIGFNEPGTPFNSTTHKINLTQETIDDNKRFFDSIEDVPTQAYTMGIASIMQAKKIVLMAFGENKADAIYQTVKGPVTEDVPASVLQKHDNVTLVLDEEAAKRLNE